MGVGWKTLRPKAPLRRYLGVAGSLLYYLGLWPDDGESRSAASWLPHIAAARLGAALTQQCINVALDWGDAAAITEHAILSIFYFEFALKLATLYVNRCKLRAMFLALDAANNTEFSRRCRNDDIRSWKRFSYFCNRAVPIMTIASSVMVVVRKLVQDVSTRTITFMKWYPYPAYTSPWFEMTLAVELITSFINMVVMGTCDVIFLLLVAQFIIQFKILGTNLENIRTTVAEAMRRKELLLARAACGNDVILESAQLAGAQTLPVHRRRPQEFRRQMELYLRECILRHQLLLGMADDLNSMFKHMLGSQVILNVLLGVAWLYVKNMSAVHSAEVAVLLGGILTALCEITLYCWCAEQLTTESLVVRDAAYACDWLDCSEGFKRSLRVIMSRSQRPVVVRAAGIPLSRRTFKTICRIGYYLHMLLSKFYYGVKIIQNITDND